MRHLPLISAFNLAWEQTRLLLAWEHTMQVHTLWTDAKIIMHALVCTVTGVRKLENGARRGHTRRQRSHQTAENDSFSRTLQIRLTADAESGCRRPG